MREGNQSSTRDFILLGVSGQQQQEDFFFILFLLIYPITLIGNLLIILAIFSDIRLHHPMYFLLANLSFVDIFFSSVTIPKMLANHLLSTKTISFGGCLTQMYFMIALGNTDSYILAAMAYDRAVAISRPLHYTKAFSTCGSHLTVVSLYYGTVMGMYFRPLTSYSLKDAVITVMYMTVTPMLNPFIYSLRNRDMKAALGKLVSKRIST
ncbi:PREDICTED: LOW QUALITY PROTEIN: olfactory receptor 1A1-like [Myotis davidii]|uniref:LOW QUALITY PROTEIN: olfactory receptor 1A1-like n=1 Tax=Myotis davidii TaxID=225400 RepID=UPI000767C15E|nr:PREDICTED: LOW QUALITY PROTEIN: olfactory receptor 1A1-like [Myotis davidii]